MLRGRRASLLAVTTQSIVTRGLTGSANAYPEGRKATGIAILKNCPIRRLRRGGAELSQSANRRDVLRRDVRRVLIGLVAADTGYADFPAYIIVQVDAGRRAHVASHLALEIHQRVTWSPVENGYSEEDCKKFLGGNMHRVMKQVWI